MKEEWQLGAGICTSRGLRVRGNSENGVTERDGFLTNRKAEKSNWTPVSIALSSTRKGFTGLDKHSFMFFYGFCQRSFPGYGPSDVDAISRHSVSVAAQRNPHPQNISKNISAKEPNATHIWAFIKTAKEGKPSSVVIVFCRLLIWWLNKWSVLECEDPKNFFHA